MRGPGGDPARRRADGRGKWAGGRPRGIPRALFRRRERGRPGIPRPRPAPGATGELSPAPRRGRGGRRHGNARGDHGPSRGTGVPGRWKGVRHDPALHVPHRPPLPGDGAGASADHPRGPEGKPARRRHLRPAIARDHDLRPGGPGGSARREAAFYLYRPGEGASRHPFLRSPGEQGRVREREGKDGKERSRRTRGSRDLYPERGREASHPGARTRAGGGPDRDHGRRAVRVGTSPGRGEGAVHEGKEDPGSGHEGREPHGHELPGRRKDREPGAGPRCLGRNPDPGAGGRGCAYLLRKEGRVRKR